MNHRVFISHAGAQKKYATSVADGLESTGIPCWIAPRDLGAGTDWVDKIPAAVEDADLVLVLLSREALVSDWVDRELNWAVEKRRPLLPAVLGQVEPSPRLRFLFGTIQHTRLPERPGPRDVSRVVAQVRDLLENGAHVQEFVSEAEPTQAPATTDPFVNRVTTARPAYFVLLIDHSSSMNRRTVGGVRIREAVADVVNDLLYSLLRTSRRPEGYQHYFDVSVMGYGLGAGGGDVLSRLPEMAECMAIGDLHGSWRRVEERKRVQKLPDGRRKPVTVRRPTWVEATPGRGRTVMAEAFWKARDLVESWIRDHPDSLPPVVLNVSDGGWTGEDPMTAVRALQEEATSLGPTLVFNCQLSASQATRNPRQLLFPGEDAVTEAYGRRTRELFLLSSVLPDSMREEARARGIPVANDARGLVFNAPVARLVDFLQVGTQTVV
jgi:TIR domain